MSSDAVRFMGLTFKGGWNELFQPWKGWCFAVGAGRFESTLLFVA